MKTVCLVLFFVPLLVFGSNALAQSYTVTTIAGPSYTAITGKAVNLPISTPTSVAADGMGNFYFASAWDNKVFKVDSDGNLTVVAGNGLQGFSGDGGPALSAQLFGPGSLAIDRSGNLFIADQGNSRIREVTPDGAIRTVAGIGGHLGFSGDGIPATSASLSQVSGIAADSAGNVFIATPDDHRVRKLSPAGVITVVVNSSGGFGFAGDGGPAAAAFLSPEGLAVDKDNNLFIADYYNGRIRKVTPTGTIVTVAGGGTADNTGADGAPALSTRLRNPSGVAVDSAGNVFVFELLNNRIRKITPDGVIRTIAGNAGAGFSGDGGPSVAARLTYLRGIAVDRNGNVLIADGARVRSVAPDGIIHTVAGNGAETGPFSIVHMTVDASGNLFLLSGNPSNGNARVMKLTPAGVLTTIAGGVPPLALGVDGGPATAAPLCAVGSLTVDQPGNLFMTDCAGVRRVSPDGTIDTALKLALSNEFLWDLVADGSGNLIIASTTHIYKVASGGLTPVAGNGTPGATGEGSPALDAAVNFPNSVSVDPSGNIYFLETAGNGTIREVSTDGMIRTAFRLPPSNYPATGMGIDASGNIFIRERDRILKIAPNKFVSTVLSTPFDSASLVLGVEPRSPNFTTFFTGTTMAVDAAGDVFFVDQGSIKKAVPSGGPPDLPPYTVTTYAGGPPPAIRPGTRATDQPIAYPNSVAAAADGTFYAASPPDHRVYRVARDGSVTVVAGTGTAGFSGDGGPATSAQLTGPSGLALDEMGNLFIVDAGNFRVRKVSPDGRIRTVAGNGSGGGATMGGDGVPATSAKLDYPRGIAVDRAGNLFVSTINRIRKITPAGIIETVAGAQGDLKEPKGIAADASGNLFIADSGNKRIRKVTPSGNIDTVVGEATLTSPQSVAADAAGNLFIVDEGLTALGGGTFTSSPRIWKAEANGVTSVIAGIGPSSYGFGGDGGPATQARFGRPSGLAIDGSGNLYIADTDNDRIRKVSAGGIISTVLGNGTKNFSGDGGPAAAAELNWPSGLAFDAAGDLFIADVFNARVRKISPAGIMTTVAGVGSTNLSVPRATGDGGPATSAEITAEDVAVDSAGNLFIASYNRVRKVAPDGTITTVIPPGDLFPSALALDSAGNLYIADGFKNRVRKMTKDGVVTTIAGDGSPGSGGDGGRATAAQLYNPRGIAVDAAGNVFIADSDNNRIRKIDTSGIISTVAGRATFAPPVDEGPALSFTLLSPRGIAVDSTGALFISDGSRVLNVTVDGTIHTIIGNNPTSLNTVAIPDGRPLGSPQGIALDASGNIFVSDAGNHRILKITPSRIPANPNSR